MLIRYALDELERERAMRVYVFPRLKSSGKLTEAEAAIRLERLSFAMQVLQTLLDHGIEHTEQLPLRLTPPPALNTTLNKVVPLPIIKGGAQ